MSNLRLYPLFAMAVGGLLLSAGSASAANGKRLNPTSKFFVAELTGESQIDTGEKIEPLSKKNAYTAEGTTIETKANSTDAIVFSNGTAIYVGPETRFEVKKFQQEPFAPNRTDLDVEPSISQTIVRLLRGSIGVCTSKLVAGSSMVYQTPHGTVNIRGRKVMIEVDENETRVALLEGDVTVIGEALGTSQTLKPGEQAVIRRPSPDQPATVAISAISADTNAKTDEKVTLACISRRTVFFEPAEEDDELQPIEVVPANLPTAFTVSPDRINP